MEPKINGQITSSNYLSANGDNENLTIIGGNVNILPHLNLSGGIGNLWQHSASKNINKPAIEIKLKYNIGELLNLQARFRELGGDEQYRIAFGGSYKIDKNQSIYAAVHGTTKKSNKWKTNTGGWIGYTYKFKNGISLSGEFQQNIPLNKTDKSFGETIISFDDSNKMFNLILSVPIEY